MPKSKLLITLIFLIPVLSILMFYTNNLLIGKQKDTMTTVYPNNKRVDDSMDLRTKLLRDAPSGLKYSTQKECEANNGSWMVGPFKEGPFCNLIFKDGGKTCTDSNDCSSKQCLWYSKKEIQGQCAPYSVNYSCYGFMIKGKHELYACID